MPGWPSVMPKQFCFLDMWQGILLHWQDAKLSFANLILPLKKSDLWLLFYRFCIALCRVSACFALLHASEQGWDRLQSSVLHCRLSPVCGNCRLLGECSDLKQNSAKGGRIPVLIINKYHCGISLCNGSHLNSMEMKLYVLCLWSSMMMQLLM